MNGEPLRQTQIDMIGQFATALQNMRCDYYIAMPDGTILKNVDVEVKKPKDAVKKPGVRDLYAPGVLTNYVREIIKDTLVGEYTTVLYGEFDPLLTRRIASATANSLWGPGTYKVEHVPEMEDGFLVHHIVNMREMSK